MASEGQKPPPPKFTSFRPQPTDTTAREGALTTTEARPKHQASRAAPAASTSSRTRRDKHDKRSEHHAESSTSKVDRLDQKFIIDRKGDPDNQRYGSLDKYRAPRYRRSGFGSVMGVPRWRKIDRDSERRNVIELVSPQYNQRLLGSRPISSSKPAPELRVKPDAYSVIPLDINKDFIAIGEPRSKKRKRSLRNHGVSDSRSEDGMSNDTSEEGVEDVTKPVTPDHGAPNDHDLELATTAATVFTQPRSESMVADLNKRLRIDPSQGHLWLELVNATNETTSLAGIRGNAEVRMSLLDEGLKKVKDTAGRESLLLAYVKEAETAMESERLLRTWEGFIEKDGNFISLRLRFLQFLRTNFAVFHLNEFRDHALEAFSACQSSDLDLRRTSAVRTIQFSDILLHTTACLREAGFCELANAIWQANLEFNLLRGEPFHENQSERDREAYLGILEEFWESEAPRIGDHAETEDSDYGGWKAGSANSHYKSYTDIRSWSKIEQQASAAAELSGRTADEDEQDDPFRVVLFPDISAFLFATGSEFDEQVLINTFLSYFQLPSFAPEIYSNDDSIKATLLTSSGDTTLLNLNGTTNKHHTLCPIVNTFQLDDVSLFGNSTSWFSPFGHASQNVNRFSFCRQSIHRLTEVGVGSVALAEFALGWELFEEPLSARKLAKKALKRHPASVRLYNAYALIEARCGKEGAAEGVLRTVLESNKDHYDSVLLNRTWIWLLIEAGNHDGALAKLLDFGDLTAREPNAEQASNIAVLKVRKVNFLGSLDHLANIRKTISFEVDRLLSIGDHEHAARYMELGVLLEYLSSSTPLLSALDTFKIFRSKFSPSVHNTRPDELLHQFRARLLYSHHTFGREFAPLKPREILLESIEEFPNNAIFFSLLEHLDPWAGITDRLHSIITSIRDPSATDAGGKQSTNQCITPHLYAARSEVRHYNEGRSTIHAVRRAFERGVNSGSGAHCPLLWRWYCIFERNAGDLTQVRQTLYRAIRACPWMKDIYMMAFDELRSAMSLEDLKGVYELMEDKELRIRIPLDQTRIEESQP